MEAQSVSTRQKKPAWGTAILLMLGGGLVGVVLGCLGVTAWPAGLFNPFRDLPAAPAPIREMAGVTVDTVDARTSDGRLLRFDLRASDRGWQPADSVSSESDSGCEPFADKAPRVDGVRERRVACQNFADAGVTTIFVLRENGRVAYWTRFDSAYMTLAALIFVPLGAGLVGSLVGLVIFLILRWRRA
jgi:hypothetical protein